MAPADPGVVVLRHRRIYILPTRRGLALIATLAIMLLTSMNYSLSLGHALTFLVAGLVASALLQTYRNLAGIAASPLAAGEGFAGGQVAFTLSLANAGAARQAIVVISRSGGSVSVDLPATATRQVQLTVPAPRRGRLALGRVTLSTDFPLGLWRGWAYVHFPLTGIVYPAPEAPALHLPPGLEGGLYETGTFSPADTTYPNGSHVCEVEIDAETGQLDILNYVVVDDVGTVVNPIGLKGQIHGGVMQGLGQAVMEQVAYDPESGQLLTGSFMDYAMPRAEDLAAIKIESNPCPTKLNPLGAKGAGEAGTVGALPAIVNAVMDALAPLGVKHIDMPTTSARIWQAIEAVRRV